MKLPSRWVTIAGLVIAITSLFLDPTVVPLLTTLLGANAAAKLAAIGALIASIGRALIPPSDVTD